MRSFRLLRVLAAAILGVAAAQHAVRAAQGVGDVPRHATFVALNLALGALVALRPRWALPATILMAMQQIPSHGQDLVASLGGSIDWSSLGVVLFFPALVTLLAVERTASRPERRGEGRGSP
jgi:hypothetical protein